MHRDAYLVKVQDINRFSLDFVTTVLLHKTVQVLLSPAGYYGEDAVLHELFCNSPANAGRGSDDKRFLVSKDCHVCLWITLKSASCLFIYLVLSMGPFEAFKPKPD